MRAPVTDAEILSISVSDPDRFAALYERHAARVLGYLARRLGDTAAEDAAAETFVGAFRARDAFRPEHDTALPWLLGIANHIIARHRRAEGRRLAALQRLAAATPTVSDDQISELTPQLVRALRRLAEGDRDTLLLAVWELSYEEVAAALQIPVGTVRSRINRRAASWATRSARPRSAPSDRER